jgi:superfamily II DNA or RNA helicase
VAYNETLVVRQKNHAYITVDCPAGVANELTDFFTFYVPGYKFMPAYKNKMWDGKIRLYDSRKKELYAGLYKYLEEFANTPGRDYHIEVEHDPYYGRPDTTYDYDENVFKDITLTSNDKEISARDYQLRALDYALRNKRGLLISPTASGKSLIIYLILRYFLENNNKKLLIVVPTTSLVQQLYSDFADYSKYDDSFDAESICHRVYSGLPKNSDGHRVIISTWQSIYKLQGQYFEQFGGVIGDEAHNFKAKSLTSILTKCREAEYRFGTTGTLDGTQTHKLVLEGLFGPAYYVTTTRSLMDEGSLAELKIKILLLKYEEEIRRGFTKKKYQEEVDFIVTYEQRNRFIRNLAIDQDGNTLVLFQYVEKHGKPLYESIVNKLNEKRKSERKVFFVAGETDVDDREAVRKITEKEKDAIIVASLGTFSTGINIRNIHNIIFASPSKSQIRILQSIGRGLRKSDDGRATTLYDIADDLHWKSKKNYTLNHAAERIKIYSKEKFDYKIYEIDL